MVTINFDDLLIKEPKHYAVGIHLLNDGGRHVAEASSISSSSRPGGSGSSPGKLFPRDSSWARVRAAATPLATPCVASSFVH